MSATLRFPLPLVVISSHDLDFKLTNPEIVTIGQQPVKIFPCFAKGEPDEEFFLQCGAPSPHIGWIGLLAGLTKMFCFHVLSG